MTTATKKKNTPRRRGARTSPAKPAAASKPRDEQQHLDGMEPKRIAELDTASRVYADARDARIEMSGPEKDTKAMLIDLMKKHDLELYESKHGLITKITHKGDDVKVEAKKKKKKDEDDD